MKKILIYKVSDGHFIDSLYHSLGEGFIDIGKDVVFFDVNTINIEKELKKILNNNDIDFSIGHNEFGAILANNFSWLRSIYKKIEHIAILDDAPYNIVTFKIRYLRIEKLFIAYRDRSHENYLNFIKQINRYKLKFFLPFGGLLGTRQEFIKKDIDIVFSGMYYGYIGRVWENFNIEDSIKKIVCAHGSTVLCGFQSARLED